MGAALVNRANCLVQLGRVADAITAFDQVADRFASDPEPGIRSLVTLSRTNRGVLVSQLGRVDGIIGNPEADQDRPRRGLPWRRR